MYKHLTPKKDQLFRRQVKQAFEQRQKNSNIRTNRQTDKQNAIGKPHSTNGDGVGKHGNIRRNEPCKEESCSLRRDCEKAVQRTSSRGIH